MMYKKLPSSFYQRSDVLNISKELLGKVLVTYIDGIYTCGIITETEAYMAPEDKASHAYNNRRTNRTEIFYTEGGTGYVYMCYGIHYLFNIITNTPEVPHAILIRSLEPLKGIEYMMERRNKKKMDYTLTTGPGSLSKALGITKKHNGLPVTGDTIWIEDRGIAVSKIISTTRVGIDYAEEYALKKWRYYIDNTPWISKK